MGNWFPTNVNLAKADYPNDFIIKRYEWGTRLLWSLVFSEISDDTKGLSGSFYANNEASFLKLIEYCASVYRVRWSQTHFQANWLPFKNPEIIRLIP